MDFSNGNRNGKMEKGKERDEKKNLVFETDTTLRPDNLRLFPFYFTSRKLFGTVIFATSHRRRIQVYRLPITFGKRLV